MLSLIINAFGMEKTPDQVVGAQRKVDLSGNIFSFSMPENFSKDLPGNALLEQLDIEKPIKETLLIQRWWDIKKPGFFGSELGSVMMTINVVPVPLNTAHALHARAYDISNRVDLILATIENLKKRYTGMDEYSLPELAHVFGAEPETEFRDDIYNRQKWTSYSIAGPGAILIVNHALPVNAHCYIEASFTYSPNSNVSARYFLDFAYRLTELVEQSFHLHYNSDSVIKNVVEARWLEQSTDDAIKNHREEIIKLFDSKHLNPPAKSNE